MIEEEGEIECRIPIPRNLAIQQDHAITADENILRTEIAVDEAIAGTGQPHCLSLEKRSQGRMLRAGGEQVWFNPQFEKVCSAVEQFPRFGIPIGVTMDLRDESSRAPGQLRI